MSGACRIWRLVLAIPLVCAFAVGPQTVFAFRVSEQDTVLICKTGCCPRGECCCEEKTDATRDRTLGSQCPCQVHVPLPTAPRPVVKIKSGVPAFRAVSGVKFHAETNSHSSTSLLVGQLPPQANVSLSVLHCVWLT